MTSDKATKAPDKASLETIPYMQNRELSWLDFDLRVLDQGADESVPLLQRLNFVSIFWSNLQEFFMVRVGSLTDLCLVKKPIIDYKSKMTPAEQLKAIYKKCHEIYPRYEETFETTRKLLEKQGVVHLRPEDLSAQQADFVKEYAQASILPFLSPQIINSRHPFPHLENGGLYIVVRLDEQASSQQLEAKDKRKGKKGEKKGDAHETLNVGAQGAMLGLIPLPRQCKRVIKLPGDGLSYILLEHVIEMLASEVFSMYSVKHTNVICVTRNADIDVIESTDEYDDDYREHMKRILKKRGRLAPVRLECERELSSALFPMLLKALGLKKSQVFVTSVPLDLSYTWGLGNMIPAAAKETLDYAPFTPQWPSYLKRGCSMIEEALSRDIMLSYPYQSMDPFVQLLREAAHDPRVVSIKITLYRLASQSHLAEALIDAAENGKEVTALFELRARFDENNNIEWSQRFEQAGCKVIYGFHDFKVHSKICSITLQTEDGLRHITQLGTGNYNEKTAKLYTDLSIITPDPLIGRDAVMFFRNMALENASDDYNILWVAPLQVKRNIIRGIDEQIELARQGRPCGLFFKTNSVTDKDIINKIAEASQAGVKTVMLVRGISCLLPGVEGYTDNVRVVSIVGRLLEHSRIYGFGPHDDMKLYLASADLMTRNMSKRVEIAWPVLNEEIRDRVMSYIDTCLRDTAKLRELLPDGSYTALGALGEDRFDSQEYLMDLARRNIHEADHAREQERANRYKVPATSVPDVTHDDRPQKKASQVIEVTPVVIESARPKKSKEGIVVRLLTRALDIAKKKSR